MVVVECILCPLPQTNLYHHHLFLRLWFRLQTSGNYSLIMEQVLAKRKVHAAIGLPLATSNKHSPSTAFPASYPNERSYTTIQFAPLRRTAGKWSSRNLSSSVETNPVTSYKSVTTEPTNSVHARQWNSSTSNGSEIGKRLNYSLFIIHY